MYSRKVILFNDISIFHRSALANAKALKVVLPLPSPPPRSVLEAAGLRLR